MSYGPLRMRRESAVTVAFEVLLEVLADVDEAVLVLVAIDVPEALDCRELLFTFLGNNPLPSQRCSPL